MAYDPRYVSNVAFTDLLFNIVVGLAFLFLLAFILMNPIAKEKDVEEKSDFIIVLTWDDESGDDIDLWVRDPGGRIVSFRNRGIGFMHLDRDDLGLSNDKVQGPDGKMIYVYRNKEVVSLRGYSEGTYLVNVHVYNKKLWKDGKMHRSNIKVELIKLNPYNEVAQAQFIAVGRGQEFTAFHFTLDAEGKVISVDDTRETLIGAKSVYGVGTPYDELENQQPTGMTLEETERWIQGEGW
ncbi:uncharacterized protein METZ01_LOCUS59856 [marine metagenome]|uniref:Uncharacterized protein n=1 Tax=marine metagenome TaxID=408172 RepID=A0A381SSK3_9ZZZZ